MSRPPLGEVDLTDPEQFMIELALGLVSPFMLVFTAYNAYHDFMYYSSGIFQDDYERPARRFDSDRTRLHGISWASAAFASWGYHAWMHPGKYPGMRFSGDLVKLTGHYLLHSPTAHRVAVGSARVAPVAAGAYVAGHLAHDVVQSQLMVTAHQATELQTPGYSTATTADLKPWWMPLPVFIALYG